jgi:hypothetical protein
MDKIDPPRRVRCTGEYFLDGKTKGEQLPGVTGTRTNQHPTRIEVSRPSGEWLHTHTLGKLARLERDGAVRAWPVKQLLTQ